ncbi:MAG: tyrosine/phenylalanine carboxypeptidase domain-containing protein [Candidatus Woesearchaeota archaeon]
MKNPYKKLEKNLLITNKYVKVLKYLRPINEEEEKDKFLKNQVEPKFEYRTNQDYDLKKVMHYLGSIIIPTKPNKRLKHMANALYEVYEYKTKFSNNKIDETLEELAVPYFNVLKNILAKTKILSNLGNYNIIKTETSKIYGVPSDDTIMKAKQVLIELKDIKKIKRDVDPPYVSSVMRKKIKEFGLDKDGWKSSISNSKKATLTSSLNKRIKVGKKMYSKELVDSLAMHEVGVHAILANNGSKQPFKIFQFGFPLQSETNEGLATYFERYKGIGNDVKLRKYAARCVAVKSVLENNTFSKTFKELRSYNLSHDMSWEVSIRAHRGGGCIKDHIYFEGLEKIKNYKGSYEPLFTGRVSLNYVDLIKEMIDKGLIKSPKTSKDLIYPKFARLEDKKLITT